MSWVGMQPKDPLTNDDVDAATASLFQGSPDFPLIRRNLLELCFLRQKPLADAASHAHFLARS
eukprot:6480043-Amphidinium_carterae.1